MVVGKLGDGSGEHARQLAAVHLDRAPPFLSFRDAVETADRTSAVRCGVRRRRDGKAFIFYAGQRRPVDFFPTILLLHAAYTQQLARM